MHSQPATGVGSAAGLTAQRPTCRPRRLSGALACLCLLLLTGGCGTPPSPAPASSTTTSASASAESPSATASAPATTPLHQPTAGPLPGPGDGPPPAAGAPVIRWVPIGPAAPSDPPEGTLYELLRNRDCAGLRDSTLNTTFPAVWTAAGATCQALATDLESDWVRARTALAGVTGLPAERCWEIKVTESLQQAVDVRAANPAVPLVVDAAGAGDDCPRRLTGLTVTDGPFAGVAPPTVPPDGGTPVRLEGFFVNVANILVDGRPVPFDGQQFGPYVFYSPAAAGFTSATVTVEATPQVTGQATLFFAGFTPTSPGSTPTTPGPTPAPTPTSGPPS